MPRHQIKSLARNINLDESKVYKWMWEKIKKKHKKTIAKNTFH